MKRILLAVAFVLSCYSSYSQISPNIFPKIGFTDFYWLSRESFYYGGPCNPSNYISNSYYYPKLSELGLTHIVTKADNIPLNMGGTNYNPGIQIIDDNFGVSTGGTYSYSIGNSISHFPYEVGGQNISHIDNESEGFGFGNINPNRESWWVHPFNNLCTGITNHPDLSNSIRVHYAQAGVHSRGNILVAQPDYMHQPYNRNYPNYSLRIRAKIEGNINNEDVAIVKINEIYTDAPQLRGNAAVYSVDETSLGNPTSLVCTLKASDFTTAGIYQEIRVPKTGYFIRNDKWTSFKIEIEWLGTRTMYIDNFSVCNNLYEQLFITSPINTENNIKNNLIALFSSKVSNPLYSQLYIDEPAPLRFRAIKSINQIAINNLNGKEINSCLHNFFNQETRLANFERRPTFIMSDFYPISGTTTQYSTGQNNLQEAFDFMIGESFNVGYNTTVYRGFRPFIEWSQNFTPSISSDDIPYYHTMQVSGEKHWDSGNMTISLRIPTVNEIFAQGFLAMCYGVKGIMYYTINTNTPSCSTNCYYWGYYGLFNSNGLLQDFQDPSQVQIPNERYYAVQQLNSEIDKLALTLLGLTWKNGYSFHKDYSSLPFDYISDIKSFYCYGKDITCLENKNETFVEVGFFKNKEDYSNSLLEYFMVVNRRCLPNEQRNFVIFINKSGGYLNWGITEIGTDRRWTILPNSNFSDSFEPGRGKLFKLAPVILYGGNLVYSEVITGNKILYEDLTIKSGAVLTISGAYHVQKNIIIEEGAELIISAGGNLDFSENSSLIVKGKFTCNNSGLTYINWNTSQGTGGIKVRENGEINLSNCVFNSAPVAISFKECSKVPRVNNCIFQFCTTGVYIIGGNGGNISWNTFRYCPTGIHLYNVFNTYITDNNFSYDAPGLFGDIGILTENATGTLRNNTLEDYGYGILTRHSNMVLGLNKIKNNYSHGIFGSVGSFHNLSIGSIQSTDCGNSFLYYTTGGKNQIANNGKEDVSETQAEIYLDESNLNLNNGCNIISDDRSYMSSTLILMDGTPGIDGIIPARNNFWGYIPINNLRFGHLTVDWNPYLPEPCVTGTSPDCPLITYDSEGNAIDTLYPVSNPGEASDLDRLYAEADTYERQGRYEEAKNKFNRIITLYGEGYQSFTAYYKLLIYEKILGAFPEEFEELRDFYNGKLNTVTDEVLLNMLHQLVNLCDIEAGNYLQAISNFETIVSENPGTDKALFAEIDAIITASKMDTTGTGLGKKSFNKFFTKNVEEADNRIALLLKKRFHRESNTVCSLPTEYHLFQSYPNPFNPTTEIIYDVPKTSMVEIYVFNILGEKIATLINEVKQQGRYTVSFNGSNLASGIYVYQLKAENFISAKKMLLMK